jgi:flagellar assembly protein FliH
MGSLPSLRPMVSIRPTHAPGGEAAEVASLRASLDAALAASARARQEILESSERDLVDLALVVAARVVGRELRTDPGLVAAWVREGVAGLVAEDDVTVTVSPDVAEALGTGAGVGYRLVVDPTLGPLSCVVRGRYGKVDVGAESRLRLLAEALGAGEAP